MTASRSVASGVLRFIPMLVVIAAIEATIAARLPTPPGMALWNLDVPKIDAPLAVFFSEALRDGHLPLWNDRLGLGFPLYAEGQIGAFYPPNWLIFQLEPLVALDVSRVLHLTAAGLGTGLLAIRLAGSRSGAIVATSVAMLGGAIVTKLEWTNLVAAYAWMPWILLPLARRPGPTRLGLVGAGIAWGIQALAGHPNMWLLTGVSAAVLLIATGRDLGSFGRVVAFGLLGGAIGAIQILPTLILTTLSVRSLGLSADDVFNSAATPFDPLAFAFAQPFLRTGPDGWDLFTQWYPDGVFALLEVSAFVGLAVLALGAVGATSRRARPWLAVAAVMLAIPIVAAFRPDAWLDIPILNGLRSPVRSYLVVAVVLGLLAAIGLSRVGRRPTGPAMRRAAFAVALLVAMYVVALGGAVLVPDAFDTVLIAASRPGSVSPADAARAHELAVAALAAPMPVIAEVAAGIGAVVLIAVRRRAVASLGLVALVVVPLAVLSPLANVIRPADDVRPYAGELATALRAIRPHRVLTLDAPGYYPGAPDRLAAAGIPDLEMFSSLNLLASDRLLEQARSGPDAELVRWLVGVDVLVTFGRPCPGTDARALQADEAIICRVPADVGPYWLPATAAQPGPEIGSLIRPPDATIDLGQAAAKGRSIDVIAATDGELDARVDMPDAGYVWIDRAWWPGWRIELDGAATQTMRALAGQLVAVPAGLHEIRLRLVPWDALVGLAAAAVALLAAAAWLFAGRRTGISPSARRRP